MRGDEFKKQTEEYGIAIETLADMLKVETSTIRQRMKGSVELPLSFEQKFTKSLEALDHRNRESLARLNDTEFSIIDLSIYSRELPTVPTRDLYPKPEILFNRQEYSLESPDATSQEWDVWKTALYSRIESTYQHPENIRKGRPSRGITILMGDPGSGKTTVLKKILFDLQDNKPYYTVILIPLSIYNDHSIDSLQEAARFFYVDILQLPSDIDLPKFLDREIAAKRLVLLLDSLDEADGAQRGKIIQHIRHCPAPLVVTSRYTTPSLDKINISPYVFHLGELTPSHIEDHLTLIATQLRSEATLLQASPSMRALKTLRDISTKIKDFHGAKKDEPTYGPLADQAVFLPREDRGLSERSYPNLKKKIRAARDQLAIIGRPIYLNLYIASSLRHGVRKISTSELLRDYLEFLIGDWTTSRSVSPTHVSSRMKPIDLKRTLAYAAFEFTINDNIYNQKIQLRVLAERLESFFEYIGRRFDSPNELRKFVLRQIEGGENAQIFSSASRSGDVDLDDTISIQFSMPNEIFTEHYLSRFIAFAMSSDANKSSRDNPTEHQEKYTRVNASLRCSRYRSFIDNPNLRFYESPMVLYMKSLIEDEAENPRKIEEMIEEALDTPPIDPDICNCSEKQINSVIPLNLFFIGRLFLDESIQENFRDLFLETRGRILDTYETTNFKYLFQRLLPFAFAFRRTSTEHGDLPLNSLLTINNFKQYDVKWKRLETCDELVSFADEISRGVRCGVKNDSIYNTEGAGFESVDVRLRDLLLRRVVYKLRFHPNTFNRKTFDFLTWYRNNHAKSEECYQKLADTTFEVINMYTTGHPDNELKRELTGLVRNTTRSNDIRRREIRPSYKNLFSRLHASNPKGHIEDALAEIATAGVPEISLTEMIYHRDVLAEELNYRFFQIDFIIKRILDILKEASKQRRALEVRIHDAQKSLAADGERLNSLKAASRKEAQTEARALLIMRLLANSFSAQQYFMPEAYSLERIDKALYPRGLPYDRSELLSLICGNAVESLDSLGLVYPQDKTLDGWRLFDFYAQTLWTILRYVPIYAHFDHFSVVGVDP